MKGESRPSRSLWWGKLVAFEKAGQVQKQEKIMFGDLNQGGYHGGIMTGHGHERAFKRAVSGEDTVPAHEEIR